MLSPSCHTYRYAPLPRPPPPAIFISSLACMIRYDAVSVYYMCCGLSSLLFTNRADLIHVSTFGYMGEYSWNFLGVHWGVRQPGCRCRVSTCTCATCGSCSASRPRASRPSMCGGTACWSTLKRSGASCSSTGRCHKTYVTTDWIYNNLLL